MTQILVSKALAARMRRVGEDVIRERMALGTVDIHLGAVGFLPEAVLTMSEFQDHLAGLYNLRRKIRDNATEIAMDAIATAYADGQAAGLKTVQYRKAAEKAIDAYAARKDVQDAMSLLIRESDEIFKAAVPAMFGTVKPVHIL